MRCEATARSTGRQCARRAAPGDRYCRYHRGSGRTPPEDREATGGERPFYSEALEEGTLDLEVAAALRGVDDEIAVLRVLIRKVAREGDVEATRRAIETLCRALKVQYALQGRSAEGLAHSLARVLDELGNELGMAL